MPFWSRDRQKASTLPIFIVSAPTSAGTTWAPGPPCTSTGRQDESRNVVEGKAIYLVNSAGNYVYAPKKFVAALGVSNLVVVETEDAILITTREHSQDVGKIVKYLNDKKMTELV